MDAYSAAQRNRGRSTSQQSHLEYAQQPGIQYAGVPPGAMPMDPTKLNQGAGSAPVASTAPSENIDTLLHPTTTPPPAPGDDGQNNDFGDFSMYDDQKSNDQQGTLAI